jgi:hypothetical protein
MMFQCRSIARLMDWHASYRSQNEHTSRQPSLETHIDSTWPEFRVEERNLRLGLGMDGVNPFQLV